MEECEKKIEQILNNYHIDNTPTNFNLITKILINGKRVEIYKKIIELAKYCIITDENEESFTSEILIYKNARLLEDLRKLFVITILDSPRADFRPNLFLRIKIYKNVSK